MFKKIIHVFLVTVLLVFSQLQGLLMLKVEAVGLPDTTQDLTDSSWKDNETNGFIVSDETVPFIYGDAVGVSQAGHFFNQGDGPATVTIKAAESFEGGTFDLKSIKLDTGEMGFNVKIVGYDSNNVEVGSQDVYLEKSFDVTTHVISISNMKGINSFKITVENLNTEFLWNLTFQEFTIENPTFPITKPQAPSKPDLISDTGLSQVDNITNDDTPIFNGTAEANSTVTVSSNIAGELGETTADNSGNWTFETPTNKALAEGVHQITAIAANAAGPSDASETLGITVDKTPPTGEIKINNGATSTHETNVTLQMTAADAHTPLEIRLSNDMNIWSNWEALAATKAWALAEGDGQKTVSMQVRDSAGNVANFNASIELKTSYIITFDVAGGSSVSNQSVKYGQTVSEPIDPTKAGHTFAGWYTSSAYETAFDFTKAITEPAMIYAKWNVNEYTVSFDTNEGSHVDAVKANYDTSITAPDKPTKEGYTFVGWYKDVNLTEEWDFTTDKVKANMTLYAKWEINKYNVDFEVSGGSAVSAQNIEHGQQVTKPDDPTKVGHTFASWYTSSTYETTFDFTKAIVEPTTIYAKWNVNEYTVSFESNEGSHIDAVKANYDTVIAVPLVPTKEGHMFAGWYKDASLINQWDFNTDKIKKDTILYAKWEINKYSVNFEVDGGSTVPAQNIEHGQQVTKPAAPKKEGYTLAGWYKDVNLTEEWDFTADKVKANMTLYAKWEINKYNVDFEVSGGSAVSSQNIEHGQQVTKPDDPTKVGHTFADWYTSSTYETTFDFTKAITEPTTVYAQWNVNEYTVNFETNGGSHVDAVKANYGTVITVPLVPAKDGHTFAGWYTSSTYETAFDFAKAITEPTTIYAKWNVNEYTVSFEMNGGSHVDTVKANYDTVITVPATPIKEGYTFAGWYKEAAIENVFDFEAEKIVDDTTLYAKWVLNKYKVSFEEDGGSEVVNQSVEHGAKANTPIKPTKKGHTFVNWYTTPEYGAIFDFDSTAILKDTTLYAKWSVNQYEVTFDSQGGSPVASLKVNYDNTIVPPTTPTRSGYLFKGWYLDKELKNIWDFATSTVQDNITLYAKWAVRQTSPGGGYTPPPKPDTVELVPFLGGQSNINIKIENNEIIIHPKNKQEFVKLNSSEQQGDVLFIRYGIAEEGESKSINVKKNNDVKKVVVVYDDKQYRYFDNKQNIPNNKDWIIKLTQALNESTVNNKTFTVTDEQGNNIEVDLNVGEDGKTVKLIPKHNYTNGMVYILTISEDVESKSGQKLKEPVRLIFIVE